MATLTLGMGLDFDDVDISSLFDGSIRAATSTLFSLDLGGGEIVSFTGVGFAYNSSGEPVGGTVTRILDTLGGQRIFEITDISVRATDLVNLAITGDGAAAADLIFGGADSISGSAFNDTLGGFGGNDQIVGGAGNDGLVGGAGADTINGGLGNDIIAGEEGSNYLRGDEGADTLGGGSGFDDLNGNMGNDIVVGFGGDDWVVGGKDNDTLAGGDGSDLVYGNIGDDVCNGDDGDDICRGGQDNDIVSGGAGNDYVSGDRGDDTVTGGAGADIFHTFGDAGLDRVTDFSRAQGDRVQLDPGTVYTVAQSGADTVISMTGGGQMVLVGVQMSSLTGAWIFGA